MQRLFYDFDMKIDLKSTDNVKIRIFVDSNLYPVDTAIKHNLL